jgi:hypothetical protein
MPSTSLECYFCGKPFHDFGPLGKHVKEWHSEIGAMLRGVKPQCSDKEEKDMINVRRQEQQKSGSPRGVQFLSPRHITAPGGHVAKIVKVTTDKPDNFGNPIIVYFTFDGESQKYSKGFRETSTLLCDLVDFFGNDEKKWPGKTVVISKELDDEQSERLRFGLPAAKK